MKKCIKVKAKDNDAVFKLFRKGISIEKIHVQIDGGSGCWVVLRYNDLKRAIAKAEKKFNPKGLKACPQCGRKHNETAYNGFCCEACLNGY